MNNSLFKFFPARVEFFDNFLIRATNKSALNDPFEVNPSVEYFADLAVKTQNYRFGKNKVDILNYIENLPENNAWRDLGISLYKDNGIVSLTETKDNLLMWSHYAEEHKGMVVEFDIKHDFFHSKYTRMGNSHVGKIDRVLYRKERLSVLNNFLMEPYFHKSDEWAYEKEHRLLLPLHKADSKLVLKCKEDILIDLGYFDKEDLVSFNKKVSKIEKSSWSIGQLKDCDIFYMFEIPKDCIKSITFGCNATPMFIEEVRAKVKKNEMNNVSLIKANIDNKDYRLRFNELKI